MSQTLRWGARSSPMSPMLGTTRSPPTPSTLPVVHSLPSVPGRDGHVPHAIVGTQDRQYVFVGNEGSNDISAFAVNFASGALTPCQAHRLPREPIPRAWPSIGG